jgi:hypothetical protein
MRVVSQKMGMPGVKEFRYEMFAELLVQTALNIQELRGEKHLKPSSVVKDFIKKFEP